MSLVKDIYKGIFGGDGRDGKRISAFHVWRQVATDLLSKNKSDLGPVRDYQFYASGSAVYSGRDKILYLYTIDGYPGELPIGYRKTIRSFARGNVRVSFLTVLDKTSIPWESAQMNSRLRTWAASKKEMEEVDEFNMQENISKIDNQARRTDSLLYLADADQRHGRKLFVVRTLVLVSGVRGTEFDEVTGEIFSYCKSLKLNINRVDSNLELYLKAYSPFNMEMTDEVKKLVGNTVLTDELISRFSSYEQGRVGMGNSYMGTDVLSGYSVFKQFKRDSVDAENFLVAAETGGGKSYYIKSLILQFLGDIVYNGTIMDIEGDEYAPLAQFAAQDYEVVTLNMAEGQGAYFDPSEIIRVESDPDLDSDMFSLSRSATTSIFRTLVGEVTDAQDRWVGSIIERGVAVSYTNRGVTNDPNTWHLSKGMTLQEIYNNIVAEYVRIKSSAHTEVAQSFTNNPDNVSAYDLVMTTLTEYFEVGGSKSHVFTKRVSLSQIAKAKLVICSFGMRGKSPSTVNREQMALAQIYAAHISHMRSIFSKVDGKFNFKVWEEFQRWGHFPGSFNTINTALTGGRKMGDINIIATNNLSELLKTDKFSILENLTSSAIGGIANAETRREICERLSIQHMQPSLDRITVPDKKDGKGGGVMADDVEGDSSGSTEDTYKRAFLLNLDRRDVSVVKMTLPEEIAQSNILRTGVDLSLNKEIVSPGSQANLDW